MAEGFAAKPSSTSRQKSCHACVKGKRGCDKRHPVCSRCEEKEVECIYAKRTYAEAFDDFDLVETDMSWTGLSALSSIEFVNDTPLDFYASASLEPTSLPTLDASADPFLNFGENQAILSSDMQLISIAGEPSGQHQEKEQTLSNFDYTPMADLCRQYEPWQVYDSNTKVYFIVQSLKDYPSTFAKDNCTPWMHRYLYRDQMPSSMRACFTASTLYSNITSSNKTSVFRVFCQSLDELKQQQMANTPQEKLARAQALFLYQIIGMFDGDVTLRSNADRNMSLLQDWLDDLCKVRENLGMPERHDPIPPRSWEWWIFSESVRRTIVMAYAFLGLWNLISQNNDPVFYSAWKYIHCWTLSRPLWEAPSSFDFFRAWKAYPVIENFDLESVLKTGRPDDIDDFSKVIIVTYMGLDETKQWFLDKGSVF
ncbi:hypothetical protein BP5796_12885 [Coleophoma crateriformis]|uniref:Zn(2)-C6 fungal-type domain-containing protein n=1 Tax=Coleophoma crateriformis TaxID=565419 RepID=A0A3D8Q593_9HELO|nr:hypothetical protein BP5796_12885 [Coleophoma crateriformis]